jgi:hypothetical protein
MELESVSLVSPIQEVPVVEVKIVTAIRELADRGWVRRRLRGSWASRETPCDDIGASRSASRCGRPGG